MTKKELEIFLQDKFLELSSSWKQSKKNLQTPGVIVFLASEYLNAKSFDDVRHKYWDEKVIKKFMEDAGLDASIVQTQLRAIDADAEYPALVIEERKVTELSFHRISKVWDKSRKFEFNNATEKPSQYVYLMFDAPASSIPYEYKDAIIKNPSLSKYWHEDVWEFNASSDDYSKIREKAEHHHVVFVYFDEAGATTKYCIEQGYRNSGDMILSRWRNYPQYVQDHLHMVIIYADAEDNSSNIIYPYAKNEPFEVVRIPFNELFHPTQQNIKKFVDTIKRVTEDLGETDNGRPNETLGQNFIGESQAIQKIRVLIDRFASEDAPVLIIGETGTGKELVAQALHLRSERTKERISAVNCAGLPSDLVESELFGHEKGSFTGATVQHKGHFEKANGGTLFLDEIGDLPLDVQAKLLRALQEKKIRRVGGEEEIRVNARIIAATHKNLKIMVATKQFREDLYNRLNVLKIEIPPLRERREDIPLIVGNFLRQRQLKGRRSVALTSEAMDLLVHQEWTGNVRQLLSTVERAIINAPEEIVTSGFLMSQLEPEDEEIIPESEFVPNLGGPFSMEAIERHHIDLLLKKNDWNVARTAQMLVLDRATLDKKIKKYNLTRPS